MVDGVPDPRVSGPDRARRRRSPPWGGWLLLAVASLLVHVGMYRIAAPWLAGWRVDILDQPVSVRVIDGDAEGDTEILPDFANLPTVPDPDADKPPEEEEPEEPDPVIPRGQIVEVPPPDVPKTPDQADYLASEDNAVEEETRSERYRINPEVLANRYSDESRYQMEDVVDVGATKASTGASVGGQTEEAPGKGAPRSLLPSEFALTNKAGVAAPTMASSRTQSLSGAPQNDLLDERVGDATALNTRKFYGEAYMNRIRRQVNLYWNQNIQNLPSSVRLSKSRYLTVLDVVLNADGALESVTVVDSSTLDPVDLCVVNAFRVAQPFPNPPEQLISRDGRVYLPEFGFQLEVGHAQLPYQGVDPRAGVQFPGIMRAPR